MSATTAPETAAEFETPTARPGPGLWAAAKAVLKPVASLQLTVALFAMSIVLVFFGTVAQMEDGIWTVVDEYFYSWFVMIDLQLIVRFAQVFFGVDPATTVDGAFPFPAGKLIGYALLANLVAAHLVRFKLSWRRAGVITLHAGVGLLFVGEIITRERQIEQKMVIAEGQTVNYAFDNRNPELAFVTDAGDGQDRVVVVPSLILRAKAGTGERITDPALPVDIGVDEYMLNSEVDNLADRSSVDPAAAGYERNYWAKPMPEVSGIETKRADLPSAYLTLLKKGTDEVVGRYLVSLWFEALRVPMAPQPLTVDGKTYEISLRHKRYYKPFTMSLNDFRFDRYPGTNTPRNYSSEVRLVDPVWGVDRTLTIRMNEPLRYDGEAYYQAGFDEDTERGTILQVVRNPGWLIPYISCGVVTLGMLIHFGIHLFGFLRKVRENRLGSARPTGPVPVTAISPTPRTPFQQALPWGMVAVAGLYLLSSVFRPDTVTAGVAAAGELPVQEGGRLKPLDTVARVDLRLISHREEVKVAAEKGKPARTLPAIEWLLDVVSAGQDDIAAFGGYEVFRIENDQLLDLLNLKPRSGLRYSINDLGPSIEKLLEAARKAEAKPDKERSLFDTKAIELSNHVTLVSLARCTGKRVQIIPPAEAGGKWRSLDDAGRSASAVALDVRSRLVAERNLPADPKEMTPEQRAVFEAVVDESRAAARKAEPATFAWVDMMQAYSSGDDKKFAEAVAKFRAFSDKVVPPGDLATVRFEEFMNRSALYYQCSALYVFAWLLCMASWLAGAVNAGLVESLRRSAFWVLVLTLLVHTFTLIARMYLMDRPMVFVTNLYSSAVFIGWAAVGLCLIVERIFPIGLGNVVAALLGFGTSIIAHNLALNGDTLEMMQAVLDTNFWLAVHVTTVTLGYSATFVAGALGVVYVLLGVMTPLLSQPVVVGSGAETRVMDLGRVLGQVIYGILCLATLLSFFGTVSGGIWADQSWGRFWGWDPKENGAVLIVTWNALILHARWAGLVKDRGIAVLALVGNMITTWSWFGTNQLQVGLHSYGFSNDLIKLCLVVWASHLVLIGIGLAPKSVWASFAGNPAIPPAFQPKGGRGRG